jgi:hypothetical protein
MDSGMIVGIAIVVIVIIVIVTYVTLALVHNTWDPTSKKFWTGEKKETKKCKEGEVTIKDGLLVPCTVTKEGFMYTGRVSDDLVFRSIPVDQRNSIASKPESEQIEFFKRISTCVYPSMAVYCDVSKPFEFWFHKGLLDYEFKYRLSIVPGSVTSKPPKPGFDANRQPDLTDANWVKIDTFDKLQEMWNDAREMGKALTEADRANIKKNLPPTQKLFKVNWEANPITLTMNYIEDGAFADFIPGVDIPWGTFLEYVLTKELANKTWPIMNIPAGNSENPEKLPQGRLLYNFLSKAWGNLYMPDN